MSADPINRTSDHEATAGSLKLFLSYSRRDMADADAIVACLEKAGFEVTIDRRDLPYGEEWQAELADFIKASDTVVWLVSPASVASKWCRWELGQVQRLNKRLIPVTIDAVAPEDLPEALGRIHMLPAEGVFDTPKHLEELVKAINTDRGWLKEHSRLGDRARQWSAKDRPGDRLLRGSALSEAESWRDWQPKSAPQPSDDILDLILASRRAQGRRQRITVMASLAVAIVALGLSVFALIAQQRAEEQEAIALQERDRAEEQEAIALQERDRAEEQEAVALQERDRADQERYRAEVGQIEALISASTAQLPGSQEGDALAALIYGLDAATSIEVLTIDEPEMRDRVTQVLQRSVNAVWERNRFEQLQGRVIAVAASHEGDRIGAIDNEGTIAIWARSGELIKTIPTNHTDNAIWAASFDDQFRRVALLAATTTPDGRITPDSVTSLTIWDLETEEPRFIREGPDGWALRVDFNADGNLLVTSGRETTNWWSVDGREMSDPGDTRFELGMPGQRQSHQNVSATIEDDGHTIVVSQPSFSEPIRIDTQHGWIDSWAFASDGYTLITGGRDGKVKLWFFRPKFAGRPLPIHPARSLAISSDRIALAGWEGQIHLLSRKGSLIWETPTLTGNRVPKVELGPGGQLAAILRDGSVTLFGPDGEPLLQSHSAWGQTVGLGFLDSGAFWLASLSADQVVFRDAAGIVQAISPPLDLGIWSVRRSGDAMLFATVGSADHPALYDSSGLPLYRLPLPADRLIFRPRSLEFATASTDGYVRLWDGDGQLLHAFPNFLNGATFARFSPDGEFIATSGLDGTARVWNVDSRQLLRECSSGKAGRIHDIAFEPSGASISMVLNDGTLHQCSSESLEELVDRACKWIGDYLQHNTQVTQRHRDLCSR